MEGAGAVKAPTGVARSIGGRFEFVVRELRGVEAHLVLAILVLVVTTRVGIVDAESRVRKLHDAVDEAQRRVLLAVNAEDALSEGAPPQHPHLPIFLLLSLRSSPSPALRGLGIVVEVVPVGFDRRHVHALGINVAGHGAQPALHQRERLRALLERVGGDADELGEDEAVGVDLDVARPQHVALAEAVALVEVEELIALTV